jgi:hypothetical protein
MGRIGKESDGLGKDGVVAKFLRFSIDLLQHFERATPSMRMMMMLMMMMMMMFVDGSYRLTDESHVEHTMPPSLSAPQNLFVWR